MGTTVGLLVMGALGMAGWYLAYLEVRAAHARRTELDAALAGEAAAKGVAVAAEARAASAVAQLEAAKTRAGGLQAQLETERRARASSGRP